MAPPFTDARAPLLGSTVPGKPGTETTMDDFGAAIVASRICEMASSFPPPGKDDIVRLVAPFRTGTVAHWQAEIQRRARDGETARRARAIVEVLSVLTKDETDPWSESLKISLELFPDWPLPALLSVGTAREGPEAVRRLRLAHRLVAFGDDAIVAESSRLLHCYGDRLNVTDRVTLARITATHRPTMAHLAEWIDYALKGEHYPEAMRATRRALEFHGWSPEQWIVDSHNYDECLGASVLCSTLIRTAVRTHDSAFAFDMWNAYQRRFSELAVSIAPTPNEAAEALGGMASADVQRFMRSESGEPWSSILEQADAIENAILAYGRCPSAKSRHAHRLMAQLVMSCARKARRRDVQRGDLDALVSRALKALQDWHDAADRIERPKIRRRRVDFLLEIGRVEDALALQGPAQTALHRARELVVNRSSREAIKELLKALSSPTLSEAREVVAFCCAVARVIEETARRGVVLPTALHDRARRALGQRTGLLVDVANRHIENGHLAAADMCIKAAWLAEPNAPNLWHLRMRVLFGREAYADVIRELSDAFEAMPSLKQDDRLVGIFVTALRRMGQRATFTPSSVWKLAQGPGHVDAFARYDVLRWQLDTDSMECWPERLLESLQLAPLDRFLQSLPLRLWRRRRVASIPVFHELVTVAMSSPDAARLATVILDALPGAAFFAEGLRISSALQGAPLELRRAVVRGLTRGQLAARHEAVRVDRTNVAARWILQSIEQSGNPVELFTEWFGSERRILERLAAWQARSLLMRLREGLANPRSDLPTAVALLTDFLKASAASHRVEPSNHPEDLLIAHCAAAQRDYRPRQLDPMFWPTLTGDVNEWLSATDREHREPAAALLWIRLQAALMHVVRHRIISVCYWPIHSFKNRLIRRSTVADKQPHLAELLTVLAHATQSVRWQRVPHFEQQDLRLVVEQAAYATAFDRRRRGSCEPVRLVWYRRSGQPYLAMVDRRLLREALSTILENATQALTRNPKHDGWIQLSISASGGSAVIEISDNGVGCTQDEVEALNDPTRMPTSIWGSGFGTRLCHRIVGLHGGNVTFFSRGPLQGMQVRLALPL